MCTRSDPVPGWTDNHYGATGFLVGICLGIIRTMHVNLETVGDMVPCDMAVSALLATAWHIQERRRCETEYSYTVEILSYPIIVLDSSSVFQEAEAPRSEY